MNKLIDVHVNSILLYVTIPPPPQRPGQIPIPSYPKLPYSLSTIPNSVILTLCHAPILSSSHSAMHPFCHTAILPYSQSVILPFPCHYDNAAIATTTAETTEERDEEREGGVVMESSVDKPGEQPTADNEEGPPATSEGVGTVGSEISPPEAPPPTEDTVDMTKERPLQRSKSFCLMSFNLD